MDDNNLGLILTIAVAIVIPIVLILTNKVVAVRQERITSERENAARELEVKIRMSSGLGVVADFNDLARVYCELGRLEEAEKCMQKAVAITENELGLLDPTLAPSLENYATVLDKMNRTVEAEKYRKRAKDLSARRRQ